MLMFKSAEYLPLLLIAALWVAILWKHAAATLHRRRTAFASDLMFGRIAGHQPTRRPVVKWLIVLVVLMLVGVGLLRPQGGFYEEEIMGEGLDLVIALDISKSMYADDIEGNSRLDVAKAILARMVNGLRDDRLGLVVFAGETMIQSPLSYDKNAFLTFLERVNPSLLARQGTNLAGAIQTSLDRFDMTASQSRAIILISDGEDDNRERLEKAVEEAARKKIQVFTVGIGSTAGGRIPESRTWFGEIIYKRHNGRPVITKLNEANLKEIATRTGATYFRASDISSAREVIAGLDGIKRVTVTGGSRLVRRELYFYPVLLAFLLLLLEWMISERIPYEREKDHWLKRI
ncbi:MAG TPA: VWA domain-containing protein [Candidatus Rifleibacterium sp.]|mgnify:CR=1 FL=1|nr:VWA domain-containing protein [Candidatus Rifleibacterium sp.]HPT48287.1 VWA domain-containing protein [Candidatus Rifleibacterium sp.]